MGFEFPTALNPFKTRTPSSWLGRLGKDINPLNPLNARMIVLEEAIRAIAGRTLPQAQADDLSTRVGYFGFGPHLGLGLNILDAGPVASGELTEADREANRLAYEARRKEYEANLKKPPVAPETGGTQPVRDVVPPAVNRPSGSNTTPVSQTVPINPNPSKEDETRVAVENELLAQAAKSERTSELMRQMVELDVTGGMTADNMRQWVGANQGLAENLIRDRLGRKERLAKEFA